MLRQGQRNRVEDQGKKAPAAGAALADEASMRAFSRISIETITLMTS